MTDRTPLEIEQENIARSNEIQQETTRELISLEDKVAVIRVVENATNDTTVMVTNRAPQEL